MGSPSAIGVALAILAVSPLMLMAVNGQQSFCSYFGNKSPSPQPGLANCTWYRDSSCCVNEEITSLFTQVEVPDRANGRCRNYINYLMCYVCDPRQNVFYDQERLTVCADFCDDLLSACSDAVLKGDRLGTRYGTNGTAYCLDRRFQVSSQSESCFTLEASKRTLKGSASLAKPNMLLMCLMALLVGVFGKGDGKLLASVLFVCLGVLLMGNGSHALVSDSGIKAIASQVSGSVSAIASTGIVRSQLQASYDSATSNVEELNTSAILSLIESQLTSLTNDLDTAADALQSAVERANRATAGQTPTAVSPGLSTLSSSVFTDADSRSATDNLGLTYNSTFRRYINFKQSVVKIPDSVDRSSGSLFDAVSWSAAIDSEIMALQRKRNVRWTYFGSETGMYRSYPASAWPSNFAGYNVDYDPRSRPWYLAATSGPKAVGIFLDCSASMRSRNRWNIAKAAVTQIVNSLSRDDRVNIICSKGDFIDSGGYQRRATPIILGCNKKGMMRATPSNRAQLLESLNEQSPYGSGEEHITAVNTLLTLYPTTAPTKRCMNLLIVITDGKDTDPGNYKDICYNNNNDGFGNNNYRYNNGYSSRYGCNLLRTNFQEIYNSVASARLTRSLRVVGIETGNEGSTLPGKLGCDNGGVYIQLLSEGNIRSQMTSYYSYLARLSNTQNMKINPTSPYIDASGLGRVITVSRSVYDLSGNLLGVIGADAVLDDLENTLLDDQFGLSYAFLIDQEGRAIVHPRLRPSSELVDDPVYPHIRTLELNDGEPSQFASSVLPSMLAQRTGDSGPIVGPRAQQRGGLQDGVVWINGVNFTYYYSALSTTQYSFAFVLTNQDIQQIMLNVAYNTSQPRNYYHEISKFNSTVRSSIGYRTADPQYNNLAVALTASTFKLAARAFCDPTRYLLSDSPNFTTVDGFFNMNGNTPSCDAGGLFVPEIRSTVWATQAMQSTWLGRAGSATARIAWTYFGSADGMWRSLPGSRSTRSYDPTQRPWYHRALSNPPSIYSSSAVYADAGGIGKVVTFAQAIFQSRSMSAMGSCSGAMRAGNCPCTSHSDCESQYCYDNMCANPKVAGVAAVDLRYTSFAALVRAAFLSGGGGIATFDRCGASNIRCVIVNDAAELIYDTSIENAALGDTRSYENVPLGFIDGNVMLNLLDEQVFTRYVFVNEQGNCQRAPYAPRASDRGLLLSAEEQDNYYVNRGPIPRFQNNYGCQLDQIQYQRNTTAAPLTNSFQVLLRGPCGDGSFRVFPVAETNMLLISIETTTNKTSNFFNFNCHIFNNVARSGGFEARETACGADSDGTEVQPTCPRSLSPTLTCSYNSAPLLASPSMLACLLLAFLAAFFRL